MKIKLIKNKIFFILILPSLLLVFVLFSCANKEYTVKFESNGGTEVEDQKVIYSSKCIEPNDPLKYSYKFLGWYTNTKYTTLYDFSASIKKDITLFALWEEDINYSKTFNITWVSENAVIAVNTVSYMEMPVYNADTPIKPSSVSYDYVFVGWSPLVVNATADAVYVAVFDTYQKTYTVNFNNYDGTLLQTKQLYYNDIPSFTNPIPASYSTLSEVYTFVSWDLPFTNVTGDITYTAVYEASPRLYLITFLNYNGIILQETLVSYGNIPSYTLDTPVKESISSVSYVFSSWSPEVVSVTCEAVYMAVFIPNNENVETLNKPFYFKFKLNLKEINWYFSFLNTKKGVYNEN
ncbi:MAG: InlB B-repeat-containing protein [Acholeplasmatales bacterium]|nr:InlB B-repeat-containing protein [Acholeplasmatales bacterium]